MNKSVKTKENGLDLAVIADDAKKMSGFGTLNLARDTAIPYIRASSRTVQPGTEQRRRPLSAPASNQEEEQPPGNEP